MRRMHGLTCSAATPCHFASLGQASCGWLATTGSGVSERRKHAKQNGDDDMSEGVENRSGPRQLARMVSCSVVWCSVQHRWWWWSWHWWREDLRMRS